MGAVAQPSPSMLAIPSASAELAFELAPVGLLVTRERVIERCNHAFARMFGYVGADLVGHSTEKLYPSHTEFENIGARGVRGMLAGYDYRDERIMLHRDGRMFWCAVSGKPVAPEAPYACAIWVFEDLSASRPVGVSLTPREREIGTLILAGRTSKQIAKDLLLSHRTVETYRLRLMQKLQVRTVGELIGKMLGIMPPAL